MKTLLILLLTLVLQGEVFGLTIATGSPEGTYFNIAQDIRQLVAKDGIPVKVIETGGSFENVNLLGAGKVDLAIMQLDVLRFVAEIMRKEAGLNVLQEIKVVLNLYPEEIHIIARDPAIRTLNHLEGKKVSVGPERSGSALTAEVLLAGFGLNVERSFEAPEEAVKKLASGDIDALIFVGGAPVPAFKNLDASYHFVALPPNSGLEEIYPKKTIGKSVYAWADNFETHAVPSVIMTRNRDDQVYVALLQNMVLSVLINKEYLDQTGHPKWKDSFVRSTLGDLAFRPVAELIHLYNLLESAGYRVIKK